jgi:YjbE family integral membrane protein
MDPSSGAAWSALGLIVVANVLLSGDNAVVIAMAARSLPPPQRRLAVWWGSVAAIVLRIVLTIVAVQALQLPYLKIAGALVLLWVGVRLLVETEREGVAKAQVTLFAAIRRIFVADLVMSVDNVIAVAGAADSAPEDYRSPLLIVGLATSIPLIVAGSTLLMKLMDRLPLIITLGAALLGSLAGQMFVNDPAVAGWFAAHVPMAGFAFGAGGAIVVVVVGKWLHLRAGRMKAV